MLSLKLNRLQEACHVDITQHQQDNGILLHEYSLYCTASPIWQSVILHLKGSILINFVSAEVPNIFDNCLTISGDTPVLCLDK